MKKFFLIAASAMMVFASCSKMDVNYQNDGQPQEIAFYPMAKNMTKAPVTGITFPTDYGMSVSAYYMKYLNEGSVFFSNEVVQYDETNEIWTTTQYWPLGSSRVNFLAVSYEDINDLVWTSGEGSHPQQVTVTYNGENGAFQHDLMYAAVSHYHTAGSTDPVNLTFKHALACFYFNVQKGTDVTNEITISKIIINEISDDGVLTLTNNNYDNNSGAASISFSDKVVAEWKTSPSLGAYTVSAGSGFDVYTTKRPFPNESTTGYLVVPSDEITELGVVFSIYYEINGNSFVYDAATNLRDVEMGHKYTFNINFTDVQAITIDAKVSDWENGGDTGLTVN